MQRHLPRIIATLLAGLGLSGSPAVAGYSGYASINASISVADGPNSTFSIMPGTGVATGSATGNATYSNNYTSGLDNSLPPPLFGGVSNSSRTSGSAGLPAGSQAMSSITVDSKVFLTFSTATVVAFSVSTSTVTSVQTTSPDEFAVSFADADVYFDGSSAPIYATSSTAGSFGQGISYTTTSGGNSPTMYVLAHAGINEIDFVTYTNGYAYTIDTSAPPSVPEPGSMALVLLGGSATALVRHGLGRRRKSGPGAAI